MERVDEAEEEIHGADDGKHEESKELWGKWLIKAVYPYDKIPWNKAIIFIYFPKN